MTDENVEAYKRGLRYKVEIFAADHQRLPPAFAGTRLKANEIRQSCKNNQLHASVFKITATGALER
jgi:hypothetical protein